ncbi:MAG: hypothetical protein Q4A84_03185 [Neisseria sp.]|uniref:hypothetical protein n=1 Tax=Neisseria sp. TaxID=192066 RepID=UPI0026DBD013|nr:hypothetical protein [Neisseria sp.]MDO4640694.1 hypothetical protein [Neisseria sp.]
MKTKFSIRKTAIVISASIILATQPVLATGIPTFDAGAVAQAIQQLLQNFEHYAKTYKHWKSEAKHWTAELNAKIRGALSRLDRVKPTPEMTQEEFKQIFDGRNLRCAGLNNEDSKKLCFEAVRLDKQEIDLYFEAEKAVSQLMTKLDATWENYQKNVGGKNNTEQLKSIEDDLDNQLQAIEIAMKSYDHKIKMLQARQKMVEKSRIEVVQSQIQGAPPNAVTTNIAKVATQGAAVLFLSSRTEDYKNRAKGLRKESANRSKNMF